MTAYALMAGANDLHLGLLAGLTALSTVGSVLGAHAVGLLGARRSLCVWASVCGRTLWAGLCVLPFLPLPPEWRLALFLVVVLAGNFLVNVAGAAWLSWMSDLVPIQLRGRYFGWRNTVLGAVAMATAYVAGLTFDSFVARGQQATGLAVIFGVSALFAVAAGLVLRQQWEPPAVGERPRPIADTLRRPIEDSHFRRLLLFLLLWSAATGLAGPFFAAHMIRNLDMSFSVIAVYSVVAGTMNLLALPAWGRIIDRLGNRPVLVLTMIGVGILPLLWLPATPARLLPIWIDAFLTGVFWPGFTLASFNLILATAPEKDRSAYLGMQSLAVGLPAFAASMAGGLLATAMGGLHLRAFGQTFVNFHVLFAVSAIARFLLVPLALRLREEKAGTVGALLDLVGDKVSQRFLQGFQSGATIVRRMGGRS